MSNALQLSTVYIPCFQYYDYYFDYFSRRKRGNHQFHIFPTFSCFVQRLINMKMYDKQLYANVEDLLV